MSEQSTKIDNFGSLDPSLKVTRKPKEVNKEIGKEEFLQLLVTQLKNQDPLEPMKNEEFAVNLAQFSQLEQLIAINNKIGGDGGSAASSLASYLGTEVTLATDTLMIKGGDAGAVKFNLAADTSTTTLELLDGEDRVVGRVELGELEKGEHKMLLDDVNMPDGEYRFRIAAQGSVGGGFTEQGEVIGIVSGFVPGPEPLLIVGGREVAPSDIAAVRLPVGQ